MMNFNVLIRCCQLGLFLCCLFVCRSCFKVDLNVMATAIVVVVVVIAVVGPVMF